MKVVFISLEGMLGSGCFIPVLLLLLAGGCASTSSGAGGAAGGAGAGGAGGTGKIGDPCPNGSGDCAGGLSCAGEDPGGGQCYRTCPPRNDASCGDTTKYACSSEGHCYLRCTTLADCSRSAQGYVCKDDSPARPPVKFCDVP